MKQIAALILTLAVASSTACSNLTVWHGVWVQPGWNDAITVNQTWFSSKGTCLGGVPDAKSKLIFYNESTRCKRCILFIARHVNVIQYRESECFDAADDDHSRICASITPDTVLYTLFRDNAQSIPCPLDQSWYFIRDDQRACQPKAFHRCASTDTFQLLYPSGCSKKPGSFFSERLEVTATCLAQFSDGNVNYVISRQTQSKQFICFSYAKARSSARHSLPHEVYLSQDATCRDLLTRESTTVLKIASDRWSNQEWTDQRLPPKVQLPEWARGIWSSVGTAKGNAFRVSINHTQLLITTADDRTVKHHLVFLRVVQSNQRHADIVRVRSKSPDHCSSKFYCVKLIYRSSAVVDLSIGESDEHRCRQSQIHYTLFKSTPNSSVSCPQPGIYRSPLPADTCSVGPQRLSISCEASNASELVLSSSCRHHLIPDIQVITATNGLCLASWRTDRRFQRTLVLFEQNRAFCLIQLLKSTAASWVLFEPSCTHISSSSLSVANRYRYSSACLQNSRLLPLSSSSSSSVQAVTLSLFFCAVPVALYINVVE